MRKEPDRFAICVVAGSNPEKFVIIGATADLDIASTHYYSEKELREFLEKAGRSKAQVEETIQKARKNPQ